MNDVRFGVIGCGFWSQYQLAAWIEIEGVELAGLYNRTRSRAQALAARHGNPPLFGSAEELLSQGELDFVDIITSVETHAAFTELAARFGVDVICQKPMARDLAECERMVAACQSASVQLIIHDNWRWQAPIRAFAEALRDSGVGEPFRATVTYCNSFPVFQNQPFLAELEQFILMDMGTHILDTVRFLFGEATSVYCQTASVTPGIRGEDVATLSLRMASGVHCQVVLSYASQWSADRFPGTYLCAECAGGAVELGPGRQLAITHGGSTRTARVEVPGFSWADRQYELVHASIAVAQRDFLGVLRGEIAPETSGEQYLETMKLVQAAYESAQRNRVVALR